jgi:hypothetical protein
MIRDRTSIVAAASLALLGVIALAAPARAVEGGIGAYLLGSRDSLAGIAPPPGTYFTTDFIYIDGSVSFVSLGGAVLTDATSTASVLKLNLTHSFAGTIGGGQPAVTFYLPVVSGELTFDGDLGNGLSGSFKDEKTNFGDLAITPALGWSDGNRHWLIAASIFAPTGYYEEASVDLASRSINAISFSKNRWAIMPTAAFTYLNPKNGREFSASAGVTLSLKNEATDYQTAPEFQLEATAMQHLPNGLALGLTGYAYQQLGDDSGDGAEQMRALTEAESLQARVFGLGPIVTWNTRVGAMPLSLKAKYIPEFEAKRRFESNIFWVTVNLTF